MLFGNSIYAFSKKVAPYSILSQNCSMFNSSANILGIASAKALK